MAQIKVGSEVLDKVYLAGGDSNTPIPTSSTSSDSRGFDRSIGVATNPITVRRIPTGTLGVFAGAGDVNLTQTGAPGQAGDYFERLVVQVEAGGDAGIYLTQNGDSVFADSNVTDGNVMGGTTTQVLKSSANLVATIGQLAGRIASIQYAIGGVTQWVTRVIADNKVPVTNTIELTFKTAPPAGGAPVRWIIHGPRSSQLMEPSRTARDEPYSIDVKESSLTGGFVLWTGSSVSSAKCYVFTGQ